LPKTRLKEVRAFATGDRGRPSYLIGGNKLIFVGKAVSDAIGGRYRERLRRLRSTAFSREVDPVRR